MKKLVKHPFPQSKFSFSNNFSRSNKKRLVIASVQPQIPSTNNITTSPSQTQSQQATTTNVIKINCKPIRKYSKKNQ